MCISCNSSDFCQRCYGDFILNKSYCVDPNLMCQFGLYYDWLTTSCKPCPLNCEICKSKDHCIKCKDGLIPLPQGCYSKPTCLEGQYIDSDMSCVNCSSGCTSCYSYEKCISCSQGLTLKYTNTTTICENVVCGNNEIIGPYGSCIPCPYPCTNCSKDGKCQACM